MQVHNCQLKSTVQMRSMHRHLTVPHLLALGVLPFSSPLIGATLFLET